MAAAKPAAAAHAAWESDLPLVRRAVAIGATDDEFAILCHQARRCGLDPLAREIHYVKRAGKGTIQVGIDGLRKIAARTNLYAGNDDAEFEHATSDKKFPATAKVTVYRMVEGQRCAFSASARWAEFYPGDAQGFQWKRMPHVMLGKVAEAQALRKAFPADMSGLYSEEEMDQAGPPVTAPEEPATEDPQTPPSEPLPSAAPAPAPSPAPSEPTVATTKTTAPEVDAFGYRPTRWPSPKMWTERPTADQVKMMKAKADERSVVEELRPTLRRIVLDKYGIGDGPDVRDSKAAASLYIDWIMNATEATLDAGCEAAEVALEGGETFPARA